jgi:hypothetical protein
MHPVIDIANMMRVPMTATTAPIIESRKNSGSWRYLRQASESGDLSSRMKNMHADDAAKVIAAQLRRQGVACTFPRHAHRNSENSAANQVVWTLRCDEASYRVRLIPHIGARVMTVEEDLSRPQGGQNGDMENSPPAVKRQPAR